jgi:hypothetical protein
MKTSNKLFLSLTKTKVKQYFTNMAQKFVNCDRNYAFSGSSVVS